MKNKLIIVFFALLASLIIGAAFLSEYKKLYPRNYEIYFYDMSIGESILIKTPKGKTIMIDTGLNNEIIKKLSKTLSVFKKNIDVLVITHGDSDHLGGVLDIFKYFEVSHIFFTGAEKESKLFTKFWETVQKEKISYTVMEETKDFVIEDDIIFDTLFPVSNISYMKNHTNNESVVFMLEINNKKILFTGDIEKETELEILKTGQQLNADILKVAHHGSKSSSIPDFIQEVAPRYAIIQAGVDNKYGHPHKQTIETLEENSIETLVTAKMKDIVVCIKDKKKEFLKFMSFFYRDDFCTLMIN